MKRRVEAGRMSNQSRRARAQCVKRLGFFEEIRDPRSAIRDPRSEIIAFRLQLALL